MLRGVKRLHSQSFLGKRGFRLRTQKTSSPVLWGLVTERQMKTQRNGRIREKFIVTLQPVTCDLVISP